MTSTLGGGKWSASRPDRFIPGERAPGSHWIGGWVGPGAGSCERVMEGRGTSWPDDYQEGIWLM